MTNHLSTSAEGRAAIAQREGNKLLAYKDSVGVLTIGVGHTSAAGLPKVTAGMRITEAESDEILSRDLATFEAVVNKAVTVDLRQSEFDALVSLAFNIGGSAFSRSTLVRKLNAGDRAGAANAFGSWNKAKGKVLAGLTKRRAQEKAQFLAGSILKTFAARPAAISSVALRSVQQKLRELGYPEVGDADGKPGTKTSAAILAFRADNGLPLTTDVDDELLAELLKAPQRAIATARATATKADLKPTSSVIRTGDKLQKGGGALILGSAVLGGGDILEKIERFRSITDTLSTVAPWAIMAVVGAVVVYYGSKIIKARVQAYREGRAL